MVKQTKDEFFDVSFMRVEMSIGKFEFTSIKAKGRPTRVAHAMIACLRHALAMQ